MGSPIVHGQWLSCEMPHFPEGVPQNGVGGPLPFAHAKHSSSKPGHLSQWPHSRVTVQIAVPASQPAQDVTHTPSQEIAISGHPFGLASEASLPASFDVPPSSCIDVSGSDPPSIEANVPAES